MSHTTNETLLLSHHEKLIRDSGISVEVAAARGYRTVSAKSELARLGFAASQRLVPALLVPVWNVRGEIGTYQIRPDEPRVVEGKPLKYETPRGTRMVLDVPPTVRSKLADPRTPLFITEGARKADAAVSRGLACVALLGVWNWRGSNEQEGKTALADWEAIALNERPVYIAFDSDVTSKKPVRSALARLKAFLESRKAKVQVVYLPPSPDGCKVGLDDFLAQGKTVADLLTHATSELRRGDDQEPGELPYRAGPNGLVWLRQVRDGVVPTLLTNFTARVVADIAEDDGVETRRSFEIEASTRGRTARFPVSAEKFSAMNWPTEHLGATALVYAGQSLKEHARVAIVLLSGEPQRRRVFTHTGWRTLEDGTSVYLSADRAIGAQGTRDGIVVNLPEALRSFSLPAPVEGDELKRAVRATLGILELAPARVAFALLASIFRAPLGNVDLTVFLMGPSGVFKSELAALAQQHWGPELDARHLPGSWLSTGNSLEGLAFAAKDALVVVDDFAPGGSSVDVQRYHREADRLLRAQGNGAGRARMRADGSLRAPRPPRGLMLATGEDVPRGQSLRARLMVLELSPGDVDVPRLSICQADARAGLYGQTLASYLRWLAPIAPQLAARVRTESTELREQASGAGQHRRTPALVADLAVGLRYFLVFTERHGVLAPGEGDRLWDRGWAALVQAAGTQAVHQGESEPARRFLDLLAGALAAGRAHVDAVTGMVPPSPDRWGWRRIIDSDGDEDWRPLGDRVGWIDGDDVYLEPEASFAAAQRFAQDSGERIAVSLSTLKKRLHERGYLASTEEARSSLTVRRTIGGGPRRAVLHLAACALLGSSPPEEPAQLAQQEPTPDVAGSTCGPVDSEELAQGSENLPRVSENLPTRSGAGQLFASDLPTGMPHGEEPSGDRGNLGKFPEGERAPARERRAL